MHSTWLLFQSVSVKEMVFCPKEQCFKFIWFLDGKILLSVSLDLVASLLLFWQSLKSKSKIAGIAVLFFFIIYEKKSYKYARKWHSFHSFLIREMEKVHGPSLKVSFESWVSVRLVSVCPVELFLRQIISCLTSKHSPFQQFKEGCLVNPGIMVDVSTIHFSFSICNLCKWEKWKWGMFWIIRQSVWGRIS